MTVSLKLSVPLAKCFSLMSRLPETRYSLLARLSEPADVAAWSDFTEIYEPAVFRYAKSRGLQDADAWEVIQQVYIVVHQKIGEWRSSELPGSFRSWLLRTAHFVCRQVLRDVRKCDRSAGGDSTDERLQQVAVVEQDDESKAWEQWAFCWAAGLVQLEIEAVTWKAFWLTAVEGLSAAEVASHLSIRVGSVYTAKCRTMARIRQLIDELSRSDR